MRILWTTLAKLDQATFTTKKKVDSLLGRKEFALRMEETVKDVHLPEKVIQFDA